MYSSMNDILHLDVSYKVSFALALVFHLVLVLFLGIKFIHTRAEIGLGATNSIIQVVAINERDVDSWQAPKPQPPTPQVEQPPPLPKENIVQKQPDTDALSTFKKNLLLEQARELAELKKEKQKHKEMLRKKSERQMQKILHEQLLVEQRQLADSQAEQQIGSHGGGLVGGEMDKYKLLIIQAISSVWNQPEGMGAGDFCQLLINVVPGGAVFEVKVAKNSGNEVLNRSAQAAVFKASPLPVPEEIKLFNEVRAISLTFRSEGVVGN